MSAEETLNGIIDDYIARCSEVLANSRPGDGLLGLGNDPRNDPCHEQFYVELEAAAKAIASEAPGSDEAYGAVCVILKAATSKACPDMARWMLTAAQKHAAPLIPLMAADRRIELRAWYDDNYPRRLRLPVQKDIYKLLKL